MDMNGHGMNNYKIDKNKLQEKIRQSGMKQSLLAHKIGVSEKTISRWVTGKIFFIKYHNLEALSYALNCQKNDLLMLENKELIHTLLDEELLEKLSPYDNYEMVEQIFLHAFSTALDDETKCKAYLVLANANWKNTRYKEALDYLEKVFILASELKNDGLWFEYYYQLGTIESINGELKCIDNLNKAFDLRSYASSPVLIGKLSNNLGMMFREIGDLKKAIKYMDEAYRYFEISEKYYNLCIACQGLMTIYSELKNYEEVLRYGQLGRYYSKKSHYDQGYENIILYELLAKFELNEEISQEHQTVLSKVLSGKYKDYFVLEFVIIYLIRSSQEYESIYKLYDKYLPKFIKGMILREAGKNQEANDIFNGLSYNQRIL